MLMYLLSFERLAELTKTKESKLDEASKEKNGVEEKIKKSYDNREKR